MSQCNFCNRRFRNTQAVRSHLKHCMKYQARARSCALPRERVPNKKASEGHEGISPQPTPSAFELHAVPLRRGDLKGLTKTHVNGLLCCFELLQDMLSDLAMRVRLARMMPASYRTGGPTEEEVIEVMRELLTIRKDIYGMAQIAVVHHE